MLKRTLAVCALSAVIALSASAGSFERFLFPRTIAARPLRIAAANGTHVWVAPQGSRYLVKIGTDGQVLDISRSLFDIPSEVTADSGGNAWFATPGTYGMLSPSMEGGARWMPDHGSDHVLDIATGVDFVWVAMSDDIMRLSETNGDPFPIAGDPRSLVLGMDGNMWITLPSLNAIGRMEWDGTLTTYTQPDATEGVPAEITAASDGNLWFTTTTGRTRGISTSGTFTAAFNGGGDGEIVTGADGRLWWESGATALTKWVPGAASVESTYDLGAGNILSISAATDGVWWGSAAMQIGRVTYAGEVQQWTFRPWGPKPHEVVSAAGDLWFTAPASNQIGRMTIAGVTTLYDLPNANSDPRAIAAGPDGALWFTESSRIGRIDAAGTITEFELPAGVHSLTDITTGPDGNLWITARSEHVVRMTPAGLSTAFVVPGPTSHPTSIAAGADGNLWFTQHYSEQIGRITPAGAITEFVAGGTPEPIVAGPDGLLWYHANGTTYRMTTSGQRSTVGPFSVYGMDQMVVGADGAVWGHAPGTLTRITTGGITHYFSLDFFGSAIAVGPDGAIWLSDDGRQALFRMNPDAPVAGSTSTICLWQNGMVNGTIATFSDPDTTRPLSDYRAAVQWGDGTAFTASVQQTAPGQFTVSAAHQYETLGTKTATVALTVMPSANRLGGTYTATTTLVPAALVPATVDFEKSGGTAGVQVNGVAGCHWSATTSASWIHFPNGSTGTGSGVLQYSVQENTAFSARQGTITVGGQTLTIYQAGGGGTGLYLLTPCRLFDSRAISSPIDGNAEWQLSTIGACGIPPDARALVANLVVVNPTFDGWLAAYENGRPWPGISTINFRSGRTRANNAIIPLADSAFLIRNGGQAPVHFVVDVTGYFK